MYRFLSTVFGPGIVMAFPIALATGFGLYVGGILGDWLFIWFGLCIVGLPITVGLFYEAFLREDEASSDPPIEAVTSSQSSDSSVAD